ncbi:hypothetical protein NUKP32_05720 [Klebsiella variicola]|nr:hypothetical protein NUKP32_05720 [Klebsiella variicola]GKO93375.1 hypothetical protein NUBL22002_04530 [Klebsiella variicola]
MANPHPGPLPEGEGENRRRLVDRRVRVKDSLISRYFSWTEAQGNAAANLSAGQSPLPLGEG